MLNKNSLRIFCNLLTGAIVLFAAAAPAWAIKGSFTSAYPTSFFQEFVGWGFVIMLIIPPFVPFLIIFIWNLFVAPQNKKMLIGLLIANIVLIFLVTLILFMQEKYPISFFVAVLFFFLNIILVAFKMYKRKLIKDDNKNVLSGGI